MFNFRVSQLLCVMIREYTLKVILLSYADAWRKQSIRDSMNFYKFCFFILPYKHYYINLLCSFFSMLTSTYPIIIDETKVQTRLRSSGLGQPSMQQESTPLTATQKRVPSRKYSIQKCQCLQEWMLWNRWKKMYPAHSAGAAMT